VAPGISARTVGRMLDEVDLKVHRIRFVYTPKHCSWLNQIEIWFSIFQSSSG